MRHSRIPVSSLWRVFPITLSSQTDMPSLTTVTLDKEYAFKHKKTIHIKSPSSSPPSFLDITPALQRYLSFPLSFKHKSSHVHHQLIQYNTNYIPPSSHIPPSFHSRLPYKPTTSIHHSFPHTLPSPSIPSSSHLHPPLHPTLHAFHKPRIARRRTRKIPTNRSAVRHTLHHHPHIFFQFWM